MSLGRLARFMCFGKNTKHKKREYRLESTDYYNQLKSSYHCDNLKINGPNWTVDRESSK